MLNENHHPPRYQSEVESSPQHVTKTENDSSSVNQTIANATETVIHYLTLATFFLFPLFFLTITPNFFETNKWLLLATVTGINLIAWGIKIVANQRASFSFTPFTYPLLALGVVALISTFLASPNATESLLGRGSLIPLLVIFTLTAAHNIKNKAFLNQSLYALGLSAAILSILSIFQGLGIGLSTILNTLLNLNLSQEAFITPAGSPLSYLAFTLPILLLTLMFAFINEDNLEKIILFFLSAIIGSGLILTVIAIFPGQDTAPVILPLRHGYSIALDTLKNTNTALLGWGPEQFNVAFTHLRPGSLNLTDYWNIRFGSSSNLLFEIVTTMGVAGLATFVWFIVMTIKQPQTSKKFDQETILKIATVGTLLISLLIPGSFVLLATLFFLVTIWSLMLRFDHNRELRTFTFERTMTTESQERSREEKLRQLPVIPYTSALIMFAIAIVSFWFVGKSYAAEVSFKQALDAAQRNNGRATYENQQAAIRQNPRLSRYHRAYAATNLALANSLGNQEELTDQQRSDVTQLIQQSIREGKSAVTLNSLNVQNWENLASIYRSLMGVAQNAPQWTLATLQEAIRHDPTNPQLRLELGGVYYALGGYDQAIRLFQQAVELKPDWANAYYNLASAHQQKNELATALGYLQQTIRLVEPNSADFTQVRDEIEELQAQVQPAEGQEQQPTPEAESDLSVPAPTSSPNPELDVNLPESAGPEDVTQEQEDTDLEPSPAPAEEASPAAEENQ